MSRFFRNAAVVAILVIALGAGSDSMAAQTGESQTTGGLAELEARLDELGVEKVEPKPWRFKQFPIIAWWPPPGTATLADFEAYRDAGFNIHPTNPDTGFDQAMEYCRQAGLKSMPFRTPQGFDLPPAKVEYPEDADHVIGWITLDEPANFHWTVQAITSTSELMKRDPSRWAMFNLLPPGQKDPSTTEILAAAVPRGLPVLSYDNYVISEDGSTHDVAHFNNLDLYRTESLKHDRPFWAFALTIKHWHYRRASESDVRWKQFTNLAYGAKGLWYFTYWGPTDWERWDNKAIVDPKDGSKTELYDYVKAINATVAETGDLLLRLRNIDAVHTKPPEGQRKFENGKFWIEEVAAQDALVGFFEDPADKTPYARVVNKLHGKDKSAAETSDKITLKFAGGVEEVEAVSWLDGKTGPLKLDGREAVLQVHGGTGVLLRAKMRGSARQEAQ